MSIISDFSRLRGKLFYVFRDGWRLGRIVRVYSGKRIGLKKLRIAGPQYEGNNKWSWRGPQYSVDAGTARMRGAGVYFRRKIVPVDAFIRGK